MAEHVITCRVDNRKQLKCLHCGKRSNLRAGQDLLTFASELLKFEQLHTYCEPQANNHDESPKQIAKPVICLACGLEIKRKEAKVPFYRDDELKPSYTHPGCAKEVVGYKVGHHNIIARSGGGWLYFWRGECGEVGSKEAAMARLAGLAGGLNG